MIMMVMIVILVGVERSWLVALEVFQKSRNENGNLQVIP
jgi:hypothetical protein